MGGADGAALVPRAWQRMNHHALHCPRCGSTKIASRRQLFHTMMSGDSLPGDVSWYRRDDPQAFPPKSLFVLLLLAITVLMAPAIGFWMLGWFSAVSALAWVAALLLGFLVVDIMLTYGRYKVWVGQWLCGSCRGVFRPKEP